MSELDKLMVSWTPRRPSPGLERRLFGEASAGATLSGQELAGDGVMVQPTPFRLGWLTPTTVSLLLACVLFNHYASFMLSQTPSGGPLVAAALSNQSAAAWLPGSFERSQNSLPVDAFDATNGSGWVSNLSASPGSATQ